MAARLPGSDHLLKQPPNPFASRATLALWLLLCLAGQASWGQRITVEYRDKPPYSFTDRGQPAGFLLKRTIEIMKLAKVEAVYVEMPLKRIMNDIQANQEELCSPSWYKLPEREKFARFSLPIHQDKPHVVLASGATAPALRALSSMSALMADTRFSLGVVEGVSYGPELDKAIAAMARPPIRAVISPVQLAKMVAVRRADYMLIDQEDLNWIDTRGEINALNLVRINYPDAPEGLKRYLMCSRQVDPRTMERIDQAIRQLLPELNPRPD
jgi:uncharacterized protein (TIGR02285 family)